MQRALITLSTAIVLLAGGGHLVDLIAGGPFASRALAQTNKSWWPFSRPLAKAEDSGYFFRLKVSLTYQNAPLNFDIVVGCGVRATQYADKTRTLEVALVAPTYYVEQVAGGHAIGVRPPQACAGHTSDNGNIPADLFPSMYWFEKAEDLSSAILYVSEDAYESPHARFKFHKASIHKATAEEFRAWEETGQKKNLYPLFGEHHTEVRFPKGAPTLDEIKAAGGRYPPPVRIIAECQAAQRFELPEKVREYVRQFWPQQRPKYWRADYATSRKINEFLYRSPYQTRELYEFRGQHFQSYMWTLSPPGKDGLPTRARGGMIGESGKNAATADVFPIVGNIDPETYDPDILLHKVIKWNILTDSERLKGFAYCRLNYWRIHAPEPYKPRSPLDNTSTPDGGIDTNPVRLHYVPQFREMKELIEIDGHAVENGIKSAAARGHVPEYWTFQDDRYLYLTRTYK